VIYGYFCRKLFCIALYLSESKLSIKSKAEQYCYFRKSLKLLVKPALKVGIACVTRDVTVLSLLSVHLI